MLTKDEQIKIAEIINNGGVIAFVTDTVWGLGCNPDSESAVRKIYSIKQRDGNKPLILMSHDIYPLLKYVKPLSKNAHKLIKKYFPGALTLVVEKSNLTPDYVTSGFQTVGIRVPHNKVFASICKCIEGGVLATTSANISSYPPALTYEEAVEYIGDKVDYVVHSHGLTANGISSTVAEVSDGEIIVLRQGDIEIN